jgi:hypothetical protein
LLQHHLHRVELTVSQTANKVHLAEPANRQTFQHLVFLQPALPYELYAVEGELVGLESALTDRNAVIEQEVIVGRLESHHKGSPEDRITVLAL